MNRACSADLRRCEHRHSPTTRLSEASLEVLQLSDLAVGRQLLDLVRIQCQCSNGWVAQKKTAPGRPRRGKRHAERAQSMACRGAWSGQSACEQAHDRLLARGPSSCTRQHVQAHAEAAHGTGGQTRHTWAILGWITLAATGLDFFAMGLMSILTTQGVTVAAHLALPLTFVGLACEAVLMCVACLFAAWGSAALTAKQLALLAFSFTSTAAIALWRAHEAINQLRTRGNNSVRLLAPLATTQSLLQPLAALARRGSHRRTHPSSEGDAPSF